MKRKLVKYEMFSGYIKEHLTYDPKSGSITWIKKPPYSRIKVGSEAGSEQNGYRFHSIKHKRLYAHHIAWFLFYGKWPDDELDHRDNNPLNNKISNLREATRGQNAMNVRPWNRSGKGLKGAYWHKPDQRWFSQIRVNGKQIYLGRFDTEEEAHMAYCKASPQLHLDFSRVA